MSIQFIRNIIMNQENRCATDLVSGVYSILQPHASKEKYGATEGKKKIDDICSHFKPFLKDTTPI